MSDKRPSVTRVVKYIRKGVGISYTNVEYADSTSNSVAPTSGWKTTAPAWQNGHYIWQRVHIVYTDGTDGYSNPVCLSGGKGISKIEEYYLATSSASGVTTSTSGWTKAIQSVTAEKKYLWNYEVVTYTDGTNTVTTPVIIGTYGDKGVGISSITEHYLATSASSGVTRSTTGWTTSIQTVTNTKKYLWNYETVTYTDGSTADTDPVIIGVYGDTGVGISSVTEYYLATASSSGVTTSTSGWTTSIQTVTATKKYLWNYEVITYSNGTTSTTTPVIIGTYGDKGVGISSITEHYLATSASSGVTRSTTGWTTSIQTVTNTKKYLWNYETVTYTDGSTANTDPVIIGVYGDKGEPGDPGNTGRGIASVTAYFLATSAASGVTTSTSGWTTGLQAMTETKCYLWNYEKITYTDGATANTTPQIIGTYGKPGSQGNRGPALRGPQAWSDCTESGTVNYQFYAGKEGEPYLDIVLYNGNYYICTQSHVNKSILPTNTSYWTLSDKVAMIAANVLFANHGFFGDAIVSGSWLISANGKIDSTTYTKGQTFQSELAYNLFNANSPLGADIVKHSSTGTTSISSTAATANRDTVYLEAGRVYNLTCTGYTGNANNPLYVRLQKTDGSITHTPVNLNSTSSVTRSGYVHITVSGNYYIQLYHATGAGGFVTSSKLVEKCFAPFYAVNLLSGKVYQTDAYVRGGLRSPFTYLGQGGTFSDDFSDNVAVYSGSQSTYALPWTTDQSGRKVVITNYYWNGSYSTSSGYAQLNAPSGKYFYEDGVQKSTIKLSREAVELLGYGDTNSFYGWIVLKRIDLGTVSRYGHHMKMLAVGRVTGTASGATISYHSFDGTTLTVSRGGTGVYTVSWNNNSWFADANSVFAMVCGYGVIVENNDNPLYASVKTQTKTSITVQTADDDSRNDGSFSFFLMNFDDWIYLH